MIDHYHNKADGLLCKLAVPCPAPNYDKGKWRSKYFMGLIANKFQ